MDKTGSLNSEIQKYLKLLVRRKYFFISLSLCIMSIIVWGSYFLKKEYEAKSTIFIESNVINSLVRGIAITPSMEDRIRVLRYAILSRGIVSKVLSDLDLDIKAKNNNRALEDMITNFQNKTQINVKGNELFIVSVRDNDPELAMNYVNALVRRYVEENTSAKREEAYGANRFLSEQIVLFKEKLDKADEAIINFRREKGLYIANDESSIINEIKAYKGEIERINIKRNELIATKDRLKNQLEGEEPFTVALVRHVEGSNKDSTITALENRINQLLIRYTDNYPEVIKLKAEIEALKKQKSVTPSESVTEPELSAANPIFQELKQKLLQTETEIEALDAKKNQIITMIARKQNELRYIPEDKKILSDLVKARDMHKNMYEQLLARAGQSEVSKQMEIDDKATTFRIVDPAVLPTKPVSPDRVKLIFIGIFVGFLGGFGGTIAREGIDFSVKDVQTLKSLGIEVLAVIPKIFNEEEQRKKNKRDRLIYVIAGSYFLIICLTLIHEMMGFTYIDTLVTHLKIL